LIARHRSIDHEVEHMMNTYSPMDDDFIVKPFGGVANIVSLVSASIDSE
jgi:hypothetical protein